MNTLYRVLIWRLIGEKDSCDVYESSSPIEVMNITVGSEEARQLGKVYTCFSRNPAQVNDLKRLARLTFV